MKRRDGCRLGDMDFNTDMAAACLVKYFDVRMMCFAETASQDAPKAEI